MSYYELEGTYSLWIRTRGHFITIVLSGGVFMPQYQCLNRAHFSLSTPMPYVSDNSRSPPQVPSLYLNVIPLGGVCLVVLQAVWLYCLPH